jgi:hypothetical protein
LVDDVVFVVVFQADDESFDEVAFLVDEHAREPFELDLINIVFDVV